MAPGGEGQQSAGLTPVVRTEFDRLHDAGSVCIAASVAECATNLGEIHQIDLDIGTWVARVPGPERDQLDAGRRELAHAEYCAASGLYRQAFASARLFLELSFAGVYFSTHELERRKWLSDRTDFSWSDALDENTGLLSRNFVQEFAPTLVEDAKTFAGQASKCYRFCSQLVHGKASISRAIPDGLLFNSPALREWCDSAQSAADAVLFLLLVRYGADLDATNVGELQDVIAARFGHLLSVRALIGLASD